MLVLTRKADEQILIGDDIKITLVRVRGNSVRIGIEAPREIRVVRGELEQRESSETDVDLLHEQEEVFAHPEVQRGSRSFRKTSGRLSRTAVTPDGSSTVPERQIFVGRTRVADEKTKLDRAPLASFVSAT